VLRHPLGCGISILRSCGVFVFRCKSIIYRNDDAFASVWVVTDELATAVRRRLQTVKQMFGKGGGGLASGPKRYLFSGLLKCAVCGGSIALVAGAVGTARIAMDVRYITNEAIRCAEIAC